MKIRDSWATINNDKTITEMPSNGLEIISDGGGTLFNIDLNKDGSISVSSGSVCKQNGVLLDTTITLSPVASNAIVISRPDYTD